MTKKRNNGNKAAREEFRDFAHYFVSLTTRGKRPVFKKYKVLRRLTERRWRALMSTYPHIQSDEYSLKTNAFHAIVRVRRFQAESSPVDLAEGFLEELQGDEMLLPAKILEHTLDFFRAATAQEWGKHMEADALKEEPEIPGDEPPNFWKGDYRIMPIPTPEELDRMREYIITNILKGGMYD